MSTYLDLNVLHTLPFSNSNRDDTGLPKTCQYGGVLRGRLSSQSIKRAARYAGAVQSAGFANPTGYTRTRHLLHLVAAEANASVEDVHKAFAAAKLIGDKTPLGKVALKDGGLLSSLAVFTNDEVVEIARLYSSDALSVDAFASVLKLSDKRDIALWGRFFASADSMTLDGAAQVAHAITTHEVSVENDFFTGMDDASELFSDHAGAGHPGDQHFLAGTFYKYANVNIDELVINLAKDSDASDAEIRTAALAVVGEFIRSLSLAVPQGKIRATAHATTPSYVSVTKRAQPVNSAAVFERPIRRGASILSESVARLAEAKAEAEFFHPTLHSAEWTTGDSAQFSSFDDLIADVLSDVTTDIDEAISKYRN